MEQEKILEAVKQALEKSPERKFSESVDIAINLKNLDMNQPTNRLDEEIILPNGLGRPIKIAVFAKGETAQRAKGAGADYVFDPDEIAILGDDKPRTKALAEEVDTSRAMLYRNIKELVDHGFIEPKDGEGYRLTDAGKIARL